MVDIKSYVLTKIKKLEDVKVVAGDYNLKDLSKVVSDNQTILEIVQSTSQYILDYKKTIVFAVDINHAELLTKAYQHEGFSAKVLHSNLSKEEIDRNIRLFREGQVKILVSVLMLTTGFDVPDTDVAVIARPTKSQNLYKQMVGRVLRLAEGKKYAVLLDCANVIENLGMPLDPIRLIESNANDTNKQKCQICGSENLSLRKKTNKSFWECKDCGHKKEIEQGAYECKLCGTMYTHDAQFEYKNNKLYLVCKKCPHPTLISEYVGDEEFVQVINKNKTLKEEQYLPFEEARKYVHSLNLKTKQEWRNFKKAVNKGNKQLPKNIPLEPHLVYIKSGWKNTEDWIGSVENQNVHEEVTIEQKEYLPFEEARDFVRKLNIPRQHEWGLYCNNKLEGYEPKPEYIPKRPQKIYKDNGWINYDNWLGIDLKKQKELEEFKRKIISNNKESLCKIFEKNPFDLEGEKLDIVFNKMSKENLLFICNNSSNEYLLRMLLNKAIELNNYDIFKSIVEKTYELSDSMYESALKWNSNATRIKSFKNHIREESVNKLLSYIKPDNDFRIIKYLIDHSICNKDVLFYSIDNTYIDIANEVVANGITIDDIIDSWDVEEGLEDLKKVFNVFPDIWKSYDISGTINSLEEDLWFTRVIAVKDFVKLLSDHKVSIEFKVSSETKKFVNFLIDHELVDNYSLEDNILIFIKNNNRFITDIALFNLSLNSDYFSWSDFELAILENFDVEILQIFENRLDESKVLDQSIFIYNIMKDSSNSQLVKEIRKNPKNFVYLQLAKFAYENGHIKTLEYLKTLLPAITDDRLKHLY